MYDLRAFPCPLLEGKQCLQGSKMNCSACCACCHTMPSCAMPCLAACRAVGLGGSGAVYIGCNLEMPGNALNQSVSCLQTLVTAQLQRRHE